MKTQLPKRNFQSALSFFYIDWNNQQIYQPVPSGRGSMIKNAGESYSLGMEMEVSAEIIKQTRLFFNLGINEAKFRSYRKDSLEDYSGNYIPYAPRLTLYTGVNRVFNLNSKVFQRILVNLTYKGFGKHYWNETNDDYQEYYGLLNARISFEGKFFTWSIWGKNLLNVDYNSFYFNALNQSYVQRGRPRIIGTGIQLEL